MATFEIITPDDALRLTQPDRDDDGAIDVDSTRLKQLRDTMYQLPIRDPKRTNPFTKAKKMRYLELIAEGFSLTEACRVIGIGYTTIAHTRKSDPGFDEGCTLAAMIATEPIIARLQAIALHGDPKNMSTVRAAETYLKGVHPAYREARSQQAAIELSRTNPDGTVDRITARANGVPD